MLVGLLGTALGAIALASFGAAYAAAALAATLLAVVVGARWESRHDLAVLLRFDPTEVRAVDPTDCGIDETDPRLLALTGERDGPRLLRYVPRRAAREIDRALCQAIREKRSIVVAVEGEPKTGKSRCLFELLRHRLPRAVVYAPLGKPHAARGVVESRTFRKRNEWTVLWLDDLEDVVGTPAERGIDDNALEGVLELPQVVVAITAGGGGRMRQIQRDHTAWTVLSCLQGVPRLEPLTPDSVDGASVATVLGPRLAGEIGPEGLGAACVAGPRLLDIHRSGQHPLFDSGARVPAGPIIVECLMAGRLLAMPVMPRRQLLATYCEIAGEPADAHTFDRGLRWARTELHGRVALIVGPDDALSVYSYVAANAEPFDDYRGRAEGALAARVDVGELLALADQAEDQRHFERSLRLVELALERVDDERRQVAMILRTGDMERELERFEEARATFESALAITERVYGPDHHEVAGTLVNLGNVESDLGQFEQARATFERALAIKERVYGPDHHEVANMLVGLGDVEREMERFEEARATFERALAIKERVCGPDHHEVAGTLVGLGIVERELGQFEQARATFERALAITERVYGPDHRDVARTLVGLGIVERDLGQFEQARATFERALAITERVYGPDHHEVAGTLVNLGIVEHELGQFDQARAVYERALAITERVYGPDHHEVAGTLVNLGIVQHELGQFEQARATFERALAITERVYGPDHHEVANTLVGLGNVEHELGQFEQARAVYERALAITERVYGPDHRDVAYPLVGLGIVERDLGQFEQARATFERALAITERVYGPDHHEVADTLVNLAVVERELGQLERAEHAVRRALTILRPRFRRTILTRGRRGVCLRA